MTQDLSPQPNQHYERIWARNNRVKSIIAMIHPMAVIVATGMVLACALIAERGIQSWTTLGFMLAAMASAQICIGITNEVCDRHLDSRAKPWRAIPAGYISVFSASVLGTFFGLAAIILSALSSIASWPLFLLGLASGLAYNFIFKRSAFGWLAYLIAYPLVPIWVFATLGNFENRLLLIFPLTVPFIFGVHLINQLPDFEDDAAFGIQNILHQMGKSKAVRICFLLLLFGPFLLLLPHELYRAPFLASLFLLSLALHWVLITPLVKAYRTKPSNHGLREIFRRLKLSGPALILCWIIAMA